MNKALLTASSQEIYDSYTLYEDVVKILKKYNPGMAGLCCGKNKKQHCNYFVQNREKFIEIMKKIEQRTIKPLKSGIVYVAKMKSLVNYALLTDEEIISIVKNKYLPATYFDFSGYKGNVDEILKEETTEEKVVEAIKEVTEDANETTNTPETPKRQHKRTKRTK